MTSIVVREDAAILSTEVSNYIVVHQDPSSSYVQNEQNNTIVLDSYNIESQLINAVYVIAAGTQGPPGPPAEEAQMYSKRVDFISDNELYKGEAAVGSLDTAAAWRISKVIIANDGDVSETWASGTANFNKVWTDRVTYLYS